MGFSGFNADSTFSLMDQGPKHAVNVRQWLRDVIPPTHRVDISESSLDSPGHALSAASHFGLGLADLEASITAGTRYRHEMEKSEAKLKGDGAQMAVRVAKLEEDNRTQAARIAVLEAEMEANKVKAKADVKKALQQVALNVAMEFVEALDKRNLPLKDFLNFDPKTCKLEPIEGLTGSEESSGEGDGEGDEEVGEAHTENVGDIPAGDSAVNASVPLS